MATVTFRPQAWVNDYAVDVDAEGPDKFTVPNELVQNMKPNSYESDSLREHSNCPTWAKEWDGPFECDFELDFTELSHLSVH